MYTKLLMLPGMNAVDVAQPEQMETVAVEDPFISSVIKIVEENICKADFSVKKLASDMNMSQPTLYRKVKQSTDYTIIELIRGVRMRRASVLLKTKEYGVQEVAEWWDIMIFLLLESILSTLLASLLPLMNKKMTTFARENPKKKE